MMSIILLALSCILAATACTQQQLSTAGDRASAAFNSPANQAILAVVEQAAIGAALSAAENAANQGMSGGSFNTSTLGASAIAGGIQGAAQGLRGLQATPQAAQPAIVRRTISADSGNAVVSRQVAPVVATAIAQAVRSGAPPDLANEAAAKGLDRAAIVLTK